MSRHPRRPCHTGSGGAVAAWRRASGAALHLVLFGTCGRAVLAIGAVRDGGGLCGRAAIGPNTDRRKAF